LNFHIQLTKYLHWNLISAPHSTTLNNHHHTKVNSKWDVVFMLLMIFPNQKIQFLILFFIRNGDELGFKKQFQKGQLVLNWDLVLVRKWQNIERLASALNFFPHRLHHNSTDLKSVWHSVWFQKWLLWFFHWISICFNCYVRANGLLYLEFF
jgi:hypothetical protein